MPTSIRLLEPDDAEQLSELVTVSREHLAPWEPKRDQRFFTPAGQRELVEQALAAHAAGLMFPFVSLDDRLRVTGRFNLNSVVRGAAQTAHLGYWVGAPYVGRGIATEAGRQVCDFGFTEAGLHTVQAGTIPDNLVSQRVLIRLGFERIGYAPKQIHIAGHWQDHILWQLLTPADR